MALKQIKSKIISTQKTGKVTKAMEAVSAVKMRKTQEQALRSRAYVHTALRILRNIARSRELHDHPLIQEGVGGATLLVIVTSDKGLAGSVNSAVIKLAEQYIRANSDVVAIAIGRKAVEFAGRAGIPLLLEYTNLRDDVSIENVTEMARIAVEGFRDGTYRSVRVIYQNFISTFEQAPSMRAVLPLDPQEVHNTMRDIRPRKGKFSDDTVSIDTDVQYTVEPSIEEVLSTLIPQLVQIMLYHALVESKACEHSARMVAMKNATDKTKEIKKALTIVYNKARQAAITAEVSEITGGIEAMKS